MNIDILTIDDPLFVPVYLQPLLSSKHHFQIFILSTTPPFMTFPYLRKLIFQYGLYTFMTRGFQLIFYRLRQRFAPKSSKRYYSVVELARQHNIVCDYISSIKEFTSGQGEVLVSCMFPKLIPNKILKKYSLAINLHPSLLPKYRGVDPLFWALHDGRTDAAISIHQMVEEVDGGVIYAQKKLALSPNMSYFGANLYAAFEGGKLLHQLFKNYKVDKILKHFQKNMYKGTKVYGVPTKSDILTFLQKGRVFVRLSEMLPI